LSSGEDRVTTPFPETRQSLILRLPDGSDAEAWSQFVAIYSPLVYRLARSRGFQDADACEIVQEVLVTVSRAVEQWDPDPRLGRFRNWLFRIARNLMIKFLTRRRYRSIGSGDSAIAELMEREVEPSPEESAHFDLEYRREVFRWAAEQVRHQVKDSTWQAFWMTAVENRPTGEVAGELNISVGAVHIACSRVRSRIRDAVTEFERGSSSNEE
jgi:RNA polymerase sigma-70 factor (ECF subfamily)